MAVFLEIIVTIFGLVFLESLSMKIGFISFLAVYALFRYQRIPLWKFITIVGVISVAMDVSQHAFIGSHLLAITILIGVYALFELILPANIPVIKILAVVIAFMLYHLTLGFMVSLTDGADLGFLTAANILTFLKLSLIEMIVFFLLDSVAMSFIEGRTGKSLKIGK